MTSENADYVARCMPQYEHAVHAAGGEPQVIELNHTNQELARLATLCDGVLLPGSRADVNPEKYDAIRHPLTAPPDPLRDNVDELLLQDAYNMRKPILGICFGVQILNVWRSGSLLQHIEGHRGEGVHHAVELAAGSLLAAIVGTRQLEVNSSHHQALDLPGDGLRVVARAPDGVIEAVESTSPEHFVLGVQWHPERGYDEDEASQAVVRAFIEAAERRHREPRTPTVDFESLPR